MVNRTLVKAVIIYTLIILGIWMSIDSHAKTDFDIYISKVCKTNCIKGDVLTNHVLNAVRGTSLNFKLVLAVIKTESRFNIKAKNGSSEGLMQVHKRIHRNKLKGKNTYNPIVSINTGVDILNTCYKQKYKYGISKVLKCYNGGGDPLYASKVLSTYKRILKISNFTKPTIFVKVEENTIDKHKTLDELIEHITPYKNPNIYSHKKDNEMLPYIRKNKYDVSRTMVTYLHLSLNEKETT